MQNIKQIIIVRKDLNMNKGKMSAQVAHASLSNILKAMVKTEDTKGNKEYKLSLKKDTPLYEWLSYKFTKIVVQVENEQELLEIYNKAKDKKLLCSLITDAGDTYFNGIPTNTCVAIGPELSKDIDDITRHLKLI